MKNVPEVKDDESEQPLVFYYNREDRLKRAPKNVREYYEGKNKPVKGIFKVLVADPRRRVLFLTIIALCVVAMFLNYSLGSDAAGTVAGVPVTLSAFSFEDTVYISLRFDESAKFKGEQEFFADILIYTVENQIFETRHFSQIYSGKEAFIRTTIPDYDILRIEAVVASDADASFGKTALKTSINRS